MAEASPVEESKTKKNEAEKDAIKKKMEELLLQVWEKPE